MNDPQIQGQADTEVLFCLALTFGLEDDPPSAIEQAIGLVEAVAERHDVPRPFQGTIATSDGESTWAFRYSSERKSRSLFYTTDVPTVWPESVLRDECLVVLGIAEPGALPEAAPPLDHAAAIAQAGAWLATRDHSEQAPREPVGELTFAGS